MNEDQDSSKRGRMVGRHEVEGQFGSLDGWAEADALFPVRITRSWFSRMTAADGPLAKQMLPHRKELTVHPGDTPDPVGERNATPVPWVVQKHDHRALLLVTERCHAYCRYCFRRDQHGTGEPSEDALREAIAYLCQAGLEEVILSGGDPLSLPDHRLAWILDELASIRVVRIHTRAPITAPHRVTPALGAVLRRGRVKWVVVHANHPDELNPEVDGALEQLQAAGITVLNQSVLLKGVNDDADTLKSLCLALVRRGVVPYYLHHTDPVPGNAHLRVSLEKGLQLMATLEAELSGVGLPRYVIDPPDGSGKVSVRDWVARSETGDTNLR